MSCGCAPPPPPAPSCGCAPAPAPAPCKPAKKVKRETVRGPTPPPIVRTVNERAPTPEQEYIVRVRLSTNKDIFYYFAN